MKPVIFTFILLSLWAPVASANPIWFPKQKCADIRYDYRTQSKQTEKGNEGYEAYSAKAQRSKCFKPWTVLIYMAADNDLTPYAYADIYEMEATGGNRVGSTGLADFVVELDTLGASGIRRLHIMESPEKFTPQPNIESFKSRQEKDIRSPLAQYIDEATIDLPQNERFQKFLEWGVRQFPANQYMVVLWGHGQGWTGTGLSSRSVLSRWLQDRNLLPSFYNFTANSFSFQNKSISINQLAYALEHVSAQVLGGKKLDIFASDACLMQTLEVATELSSATRYIVGSAQVQPYWGLPYRDLINFLNSNGVATHKESARKLARGITQISSRKLTGQTASGVAGDIDWATLSTLSSEKLQKRFLPALYNLGDKINLYLREQTLRTIEFQDLIDSTFEFLGGSKEVGMFQALLESHLNEQVAGGVPPTPALINLQKALQVSRAALNETVEESYVGNRYKELEEKLGLKGFKGLSVWIPEQKDEYEMRIEEFRRSRFYHWGTGGESSPETSVGRWESWMRFVYLGE